MVKVDAEQLASSVHVTSELSERVSKKVRELDVAQSRIQETLFRINVMVDRANAVNGVTNALQQEDYEAAAQHVRKFLDLEAQFGTARDDLDSRQAKEQNVVRYICVLCSAMAALTSVP